MLKGLFDFLASLKLAVVLLLSLAISLAVATFVESGFDTHTAQYFIYRSWWFEGLLALLGLNILAVALSRWPWKPRHTPFLLAHVGILLLLTGSFLTQKIGLDGSMTVSEGETNSVVDMDNAGLVIIDGESARTIPIPWIPPSKEFKPIDLKARGLPYDLRVDRYLTHADAHYNFIADPTSGAKPAVEVTIKGGFMGIKQAYWLWGGDPSWTKIQAGPALLTLGPGEVPRGTPSLQVIADEKGNGGVHYIATSSEGRKVSGYLSAKKMNGKVLDPGWRGDVQLIFGRYIPHALPQSTYTDSRMQYGQQAPPSAIHLVTGNGGPGSALWLGLGERAALELGGREVEIGYMPDRVILPFQVKLNRFHIDRYEGTNNPSEYSSDVTVIDGVAAKHVRISMNEPLTEHGITLYQSSYEDAMPRPVTSIFSVNRDPGRPWKYLGSILIVLGSILLFAMKYRQNRASAKAKPASAGPAAGGQV